MHKAFPQGYQKKGGEAREDLSGAGDDVTRVLTQVLSGMTSRGISVERGMTSRGF